MTEHPLGALVAGVAVQNPVMLAAGTAAYGRELADVVDLERLGGFVTKAVSLEPRPGARSRRSTAARPRARRAARDWRDPRR